MSAHDRAVDAQEVLHARKVAALLNSQNKLRCANAALRRQDAARKESATGRGAALARAERELLQQDVVLRAFYNFLGKEVARKQLLRALEAGPKRVRPTSREELRWKLEDLREELAKVQLEANEQVEMDSESKAARAGDQTEEIAVQREAIEEWKQRLATLEQENTTHQVEIMSLEKALEHRDRPVTRPWDLLIQHNSVDTSLLKEQLLGKEKAFGELQRQRQELREELLEAQQATQRIAEEAKERRDELQRLRYGSSEAKRRTSVVHQGEIMAKRKELKADEEELDEARARRKSMSAEQKAVVLDGKRRMSNLASDLERQKLQMQKDLAEELASQEAALEKEQQEQLEDLARAERSAEAALELSRQEAQSLRSSQRLEAASLAEALRLVELGCGPEAAEAAAAGRAEVRRWLEEELACGGASAEGSLPQREALVQAALGARAAVAVQEEREEQLRDEEMELSKELRSGQQAEAEVEAYVRDLRKMPGCEVSKVDLICLRAELTVQKDLTEQELARCQEEVSHAEVMLAEVTEAAVEQKTIKSMQVNSEDWSSLLAEARKERHLAKQSLEAALVPASPNASSFASEGSQDWIPVAIHMQGDARRLEQELKLTQQALQQGVASQLQALQAEAEAMELKNLQLQDEKRDLELGLQAAQFAVKSQVSLRGCPFCAHCVAASAPAVRGYAG